MNQDTGLVSWHNLDELLGPDCLRIASYNIHRCAGGDGRVDTARVARVIDEMACDTIGLQEVASDHHGRHDSVQLDYLADSTRMQAIAGHTIVRHTAISATHCSPAPVLAVRQHDLSFPQREPRGAIEARPRRAGQVMRVFVTPSACGRRTPLSGASHARTAGRGTGRAGGRGARRHQRVLTARRPLRCCMPFSAKPGRTFLPARLPLFSLDRVCVRPYWALLAFGTHRSAAARIASDHLPIKAIVATGAERPGAIHRPNRRHTPRSSERNPS